MLNDISASLYSEAKTRFATPRIIVENFLNPLFILFIFGIAINNVFGKVKLDELEVPYLVYFLSGAINIALITNCVVASTRMFLDKYIGTIDYYFTYPISRTSILIGRLLFHIALSFVQIFFMTIFVKSLNMEYIQLDYKFILFVIITITNSIGWFCILIYFSLMIKTQDGFNVMYYLLMTPVLYLSSAYYPISNFILPLRIISALNPLTWSIDISRVLVLNDTDDFLLLKIILSILFAVIPFLIVCYKLVNWTKD